MFDLFCVGLKNIGRKKTRSLLTILSIAIGVGSVVVISAIGGVGRTLLEGELSNLGLDGVTIVTDGKITDQRLDEQDLSTITASSQVTLAAPIIFETSKVRMHGLVSDTVAWGIGDNAEETMSLTLSYGRMITADDLARKSRICLVDARTAKMFYARSNIVGKSLSLEVGGIRTQCEIVGVVETGGGMLEEIAGEYVPGFVYLPYTVLQQTSGKEGFSQIAVTVANPDYAQQTADTLVAALERFHGNPGIFKAENLSAQRQRMGGVLEMVTLTLTIIAGISLVVAGLGIMTVMIVSVHERTREIGIKKSIGATSQTILLEFLFEALILSAVGGVVGAMAGGILVTIGGALAGVSVAISLASIIFCVGFTMTVGVLFGIYPARLASRMHPVDALRME